MAVARRLGKPVKYTETRSESLIVGPPRPRPVAEAHPRRPRRTARSPGSRSSCSPTWAPTSRLVGGGVPVLGAFMFNAIYKFPAYQFACQTVLTNKTWTDAYRGAGRPEATFAIERMMDELAVEVGVDPLEIREKNWIKHEEFPFTTVAGLTYDSGNYEAATAKAKETVRLRRAAGRAEARAATAATRSSSASASRRSPRCAAWRPRRVLGSLDYGAGGWEHASVRMLATGKVEVVTGAVRARPGPRDGVQPDRRRPARGAVRGRRGAARRHPDRAQGPGHLRLAVAGRRRRGAGQGGRQGHREGQADRGPPARGQSSTTSSSRGGRFTVAAPTRAWASARSRSRRSRRTTCPTGWSPALDADATYDPVNFSFPHGTHLCAMEVDTETGAVDDAQVRLRRRHRQHHQPADRRGPGARRPGAGHRAGAVGGGGVRRPGHPGHRLVRRLHAARPRPTRSASTSTTPPSPSTTNTLGTKGVGEAGTIASTPAVVNAVVDAVRHLGVNDIQMPCTPERVWKAIQRRGRPATRPGRRSRTSRTTPSTRTRSRRDGRSRPVIPAAVRLPGAHLGRRGAGGARRRTATTPRSSPAARACCRCCGCGSTRPRWSSTSAASTRCAASATTATRSSSAR